MRTEKLSSGSTTHGYTDAMVSFAEECLYAYFKEFGPKRPGELEDDFCGCPSTVEILTNFQGHWRESPFYPALGHLVDKKIVYFWIDESGDIWYDITTINKGAPPNMKKTISYDAIKASSDFTVLWVLHDRKDIYVPHQVHDDLLNLRLAYEYRLARAMPYADVDIAENAQVGVESDI